MAASEISNEIPVVHPGVTRVFVLAESEASANDLAQMILEDDRLDIAGISALTDFPSTLLKASRADVVLAVAIPFARIPQVDLPLVLLDDGTDIWDGGGNIKAVLPTHVTPNEAAAALISAAVGFTVLTAVQTEAMLNVAFAPATEVDGLIEHLTPRELEVLRMMGSGNANKEIAEELHISENTVKFHVASILGKLNSGSRTEAVARGLRTGLIPV